MAGTALTSMHIHRVDADGKIEDDDSPGPLVFEHTDSDVCWEYELPELTDEGKVTLFCGNWQCRQTSWYTDVLSEREVELEEALRAWVDARAALEASPAGANQKEAKRVAMAENRLRELVNEIQPSGLGEHPIQDPVIDEGRNS
jgi:hypothetical protein